ncbi:MAG: alpha-L-fucosidase [Promethearchaeota archaeon]
MAENTSLENLKYKPEIDSIKGHKVPDWFNKAKLGIFIHWGLFSVPAFAPTGYGTIVDIIRKHGWGFHYSHNPYAEWYQNTLRIEDSPTYKFHQEHYGHDFKYSDFAKIFNRELEQWRPDAWVNLFKEIGAKYIVLVTKHHDGFLLWPSENPNPKYPEYHAVRDVVGELRNSAVSHGLKFGAYYSGILDWTFQPNPIKDFGAFFKNAVLDKKYAEMVYNHYLELINRYHPSILWNDIGYPQGGRLLDLIAYYYNNMNEGVINDRWTIFSRKLVKLMTSWPVRPIADFISRRMVVGSNSNLSPWDFHTPEYSSFKKIKEFKWETTRGIGRSFGYNREERDENHIAVRDLVHLLIDIVSKNGNLLLNVGPMSGGKIPGYQMKRLKGLGNWLKNYGEGIFDTMPNSLPGTVASDSTPIRFTRKEKEDILYLFTLGRPRTDELKIRDLKVPTSTEISLVSPSLLGKEEKHIKWERASKGIKIKLNKERYDPIASLIKIIL